MALLDRRERRARNRVPTSAEGDEETVRLARKDFSRRRWTRRLRRGRPLIAALLVLTVLAAVLWLVFFSSVVAAEEVEVTGVKNVRQSAVVAAARAPIGTPLARVDLDAIRIRVETLPVVKRAEVSRTWPHGIHIAVTERTPVAVINRGNGLQALDNAGVLFRHYSKRPAGLPLVRTEPDTRTEALAEAAKVVRGLPRDVAPRVDYVEVATVDQIKLRLRNGRIVTWGSADDSVAKGEVLAVLLKQRAREIDVSVPGRPTTRG